MPIFSPVLFTYSEQSNAVKHIDLLLFIALVFQIILFQPPIFPVGILFLF